jgi:DNA replication protein DnaC
MTRRHQLETTLRTLKLSGMLDTLDARLSQARAGELGHLEFLQVLCEDEINRRDAAALIRRVRHAHFEQTVTIEEFDFNYNPNVPAAVIRDLATMRFVDRGESVILHGPVGVGKTMIAQALGHHACRRGHSVAFTKTSRLLADLAGGHADRTWGTRLKRWSRPDVLILDDFAMRDFTAIQADDLYELITERQDRSLILTANRAAVDWYPLFPNPRRRRVRPRPHHQHRPPPPHGRAQLPTKQATRPPQPTERSHHRVEQHPGTGCGIT